MANRPVNVVLSAAIGDFQAKMAAATGSVEAFVKSTAKTRKMRDDLDQMVGSFTKVGIVGAAALVGMGKSAVDWQSDWAGVTKTVAGTTEQMVALEASLREMAKTTPTTHTEIAAVAEAAGALGVATEDVAGFTKVMIDLGETTNLTADEAATSLAQLSNVMGTSTSDVDRMGSAIVALGNDGASTEREIVQMAQRIGAAGKAAGMSETDVLGFASALSSVGVEAEAGGTALSQTFTEMGAAVRKGGDELDLIAKTAGMSSEAFSKAWKDDAAGATQAFIEGLGRMQSAGGDAYGTLEQLGMSGIRQTDSLMRLAQAGELVGDSLQTAEAAWASNTALADEASKRYETAESKISMAMNSIRDSAIDMGGNLLPVIAKTAEGAAQLADLFTNLPGPVQSVIVSLTAIVGVGGLAAAGLLKLALGARDTYAAFRGLVPVGSALEAKLKGFRNAAGAATAALIALAAVQWIGSQYQAGVDNTRLSIEQMEAAAVNAAKGGLDKLDAEFTNIWGSATDTGLALATLAGAAGSSGRAFGDFADFITGTKNNITESEEAVSKLDKALSSMSADKAATAFREISTAAAEYGVTSTQMLDMFPKYRDSLLNLANDLGVAGLSTQELADWMGGKVPPAVQAAAAAADSADPSISKLAGTTESAADAAKKAADAARELANAWLTMSGSEIGLEAAIDAATESIAKHKKNLDIGSEAGRANKAALDDIAKAALSLRDAQAEAGASTETMNASTVKARGAFVEAATQMGLTGAEAAALADKYGLVPPTVTTNVSAPGATISAQQAVDFKNRLDALPAEKRAAILSIFDAQGYNAAITALNNINGKTATTYIRTVYTTSGSPQTGVKGVNIGVADGGMLQRQGSGLVQAFREGGMYSPVNGGSIGSRSPGIYPYRRGGVLMNEEGSGPWEGIVSGHPGKRVRSRAVSEMIVDRLGGDVVWRFANGGVWGNPGPGTPSGASAGVDYGAIGRAVRAGMAGVTLRGNFTGARMIADQIAAEIQFAVETGV